MNDTDRCYEILGLKPGASPDEVKQAYWDLAKVWHPDRFPNDPRLQQKAQEKLKEINKAYELLRSFRPDPGSEAARSEYSAQRSGARQAAGTETPPKAYPWDAYIEAGDRFLEQARYDEAERVFLAALKEAEGFGQQDPRLVKTLKKLAAVYTCQGRDAEAERLHKRTVAVLEKSMGPEHAEVAASLLDLAFYYRIRSKDTQAEPLLRRALAIKEKVLGPDHIDLAVDLCNLAYIFKGQGKYADAEALFRRVMEIYERARGPEHLEVARALTDLADVCRSQGEYRQAESFYRRALTIEKKVLGPDHHHLAGPLNRLAAVLCDQRKWDEAESIYRQAITLSEKVLDPDFSYHALLESLNGCSFVLQMKPGLWGRKRKARLAESERMGAQAQAILEKISVKR